MIRYVPILMLFLGLFLVSTSFAAAQTVEAMPAIERGLCVEAANDPSTASSDDQVDSCLQQIELGILIHSCQLVATLPEDCATLEPQFVRLETPPDHFVFRKGSPPVLDAPPPRA